MRANSFEPVALVRRRYCEWFPAMAADADVQLVRYQARPQSSIAVVSIDDGRSRQRVIVKQNRLSTPAPRPRLGLTAHFAEKHEYEARALRAVDRSLPAACSINRAQVLEVGDDVLVLTEVPGRSLDGLMRRAPLRTIPAVEAAGAWLRHFHSCRPDGMSSVPVRGDAGALAMAFEGYLTFLDQPLAHAGLRDRAKRAAHAMTEHLKGAEVCLGLAHGDFAPRNILVDEACRIGVIDPLGITLQPLHEDLAYFALSLERGPLVPRTGAVAQRLAAKLEAHLLRGYQLADSSRVAYEGFAVLVALDMWAAEIVRPAATGSRRHRLGRRVVRSPEALVDDRLARLDRVASSR